jgi:hypothetical protein
MAYMTLPQRRHSPVRWRTCHGLCSCRFNGICFWRPEARLDLLCHVRLSDQRLPRMLLLVLLRLPLLERLLLCLCRLRLQVLRG